MNIVSCACRACRHARNTPGGKREARAVVRAARRKARQDLRSGREPAAKISAGFAG